MVRTWCLTWCNIRHWQKSTSAQEGSPGVVGRAVCSWNCNRCLLEKAGGLCDISGQTAFRSNIHLLWSDFLYLLWFPPKTPPELSCNKVVLSCLYRPVSLYIWFVAGCMFKLYCCCSLYSVLIFYVWILGEMVQNQFAFLRKSSVNQTRAALVFWEQSPELFVQLPRAGCLLGQCLPPALKGLAPCATGGARNGLGWVKSICSAPSAREVMAQCLK